MAWQAEVPGHGFVEFDDEITQEEAAAAIKRNFFGDKLIQEAVPQATTDSTALHAAGSFVSGVAQGQAGMLKAGAAMVAPTMALPTPQNEYEQVEQDKLQSISGSSGILPGIVASPAQVQLHGAERDKAIKSSPLWRDAEDLETMAKGIPTKPGLEDSYWATKLPTGLGQATAMMPAGALGGTPGMIAAGALGGSGDIINEAIKAGKTLEETGQARVSGALVGTTDGLALDSAIRVITGLGGMSLWKRIPIALLIQGGTEFIQEGSQQYLQNLIVKYQGIDPTRDPWEGVQESAEVGAGVGLLLGGGSAITAPGKKTKSRITQEDFSTTPAQPIEPEVNDAAWQRFQEQQRQQGLQTPEGRQREINRIWEQENPQEAPTQTAPTTEAPVVPLAPVYAGPTSTASLKAELRAPEVPNIQEPAENAPSMIRSPVHEVLAIQPQDRVQAEWLAETYSKELGRTFHVWDTPNGPRLRLAPQKQELGLEYEQWVDSLEAEQEPTSPEAMRRLRADVAANRAAEENKTPAQPEDLKNKILGYNKFNEPVYQWQVDEAQVKMMKGEEVDRERITAVSAEPQSAETSVIKSQRLGYTEQERLAGRITPEVTADRTQDILGQPTGRVEAPMEMEAEADPIIEGAPKTLMGKKLYLKRLGPAAKNYEVSKSGEIVKLYTFGSPEMFKKLWRSRLQDAVALDIKNWPKMIAPGDVDKKLRAMTTNTDPRRSFKMEEWEDMRRMGGMQEWLAGWGEEKIPREKLLEEIQSRGIQVSEIFYPSAEAGKMAAENKRAAEQILQDHAEQIRTVERGTGEEWLDPARLSMDVYGRYSQLMDAARSVSSTKHPTRTLPGGTNYIELVLTSPQAQPMENDPAHFAEGEQGVRQIGWIRAKEFTDSLGRRVFHIEEVQSNRHQAGRKGGYSDPAFKKARDYYISLRRQMQELEKQYDVYSGPESWDQDNYDRMGRESNYHQLDSKLYEAGRQLEDVTGQPLSDAFYKEFQEGKTPDAPFRKSWPTLLLRRALKYAAQNGYDVVSWTTGEQEHAKYPGESEAGYKAHRDQYGTMNAPNQELIREWDEKVKKLRNEYQNLYADLQEKFDYEFGSEGPYPPKLAKLGDAVRDAEMRLEEAQNGAVLSKFEVRYNRWNKTYDVNDFLSGKVLKSFERGEEGLAQAEAYKKQLEDTIDKGNQSRYNPGWLLNNMKEAAKPFKVGVEIVKGKDFSGSVYADEDEFSPTEFSLEPAVVITPEMREHYLNNPMNLYTFGPQMFKNFFSGFEKMPGGGIGTRGWKFLERKALLPYWVMKKPEGKPIYNTAAQQREDTVGPTINMLLPVKTAWQQLSKEEQAEAIQTVKDIEGKKLVATPSNEILTNADGFVELVPEHLKEFKAFLQNKGFSQPVQEYLLARKKMYNEAFAHKYNTLKGSGRANPTELQDMLQHEGFIPNYFPHNWYGKTYIPGYDTDGNLIARVSVGRITEGIGKVLGGAPGIKTLRKELETSKIWKDKGIVKWGELTDASENERYWINAPIPVDAIGRVLDEGAAKLAENPEYEKLAKGFRRALMKDTINVLKSQGFPHYAKRKGILGYEQNDLMGVDFDYIHGLNASLAKMKAAKEFTKLLVETKADKSDHQLYADFVEDTLGHGDSTNKLSDAIRFYSYMRYMGFRLKPAIVNLSAMPAVSAPFLARISSHSGRLHTSAAASVVSNKNITESEQRFLGEFSDTLFQAQLMNEYRSKQERTGGTHRFSNWAGKMMEVTESFMRKTTGLATMRAIAEGRIVDQKILDQNGWKLGEKVDLSQEENYQKAVEIASEMVSDVHMDYTKFNKPQIVRRSPTLRTIYTFRAYNQHLMQAYQHILMNEGPRGKAAVAASAAMQVALGGIKANALAMLMLSAYDWWAKEQAETTAREAFPNQEVAMDAFFLGMPSMAGMYLGGSFESGFPTSIKEAVGVPFAIVEDVEKGYKAWVSGNKKKALEFMMPFTVMKDALQTYRESTQGMRTISGAPITKPGEVEPRVLEPHESLMQALGIRPAAKEKEWRAGTEVQDIGKYKKEAQGRLASRYTNAIAEEQWNDAEGVLDEIMAWNMTWASKGREELMISMDSLRAAVKSRTLPRKVPKQMRGKEQRIGESYTGQ